MAFAVLQDGDTGVSEETTVVSTHDGVMAANVSSGDLLVVLLTLDKSGTINLTSGWTEIDNTSFGGTITTATWAKIAGVSESNFTWTSSLADTSNTFVLRITGWHGTTLPEAFGSGGNSGTPDPPSLAPSWGAEDNLWIAWFGKDAKSGLATAYPTGFDDNQNTGENAAAGGPTWAYCSRNENVSPKDPAVFTAASEQYIATTIAIRPVSTSILVIPLAMEHYRRLRTG